MLKEVEIIKGDLIKAGENIIAHQVNCFTMGSGVAKQISGRYPAVKREHKLLCDQHENDREWLLGRIQLIDCTPKIVANLFGQYDYGNDGKLYTIYKYLYLGLERLFQYAKLNNLSVAIPYKIGCGKGGADWVRVRYKINELANRYNIVDKVKLYKLEAKPKTTNNKHFR